MKKLIKLVFLVILLSGCNKQEKISIQDISSSNIKKILEKKSNMRPNESYSGYTFYLPSGIKKINKVENSFHLKEGSQDLYLTVNLVGYYYKSEYKEEKGGVFYEYFDINKVPASLYIKEKDNGYIVKLRYNYAQVEAYIEDNLYTYLDKASIILGSIEYKDEVIKNLFETQNNPSKGYNPFLKKEDDNYLSVYEKSEFEDLDLDEGKIKIREENN